MGFPGLAFETREPRSPHLPVAGYPLLPNRSVLVDSLALKETVMHHAHSEKENQENKNNHEEGCDDSTQWSLLRRAARLVQVLIHQSRLNSSPGAEYEPGECRADS